MAGRTWTRMPLGDFVTLQRGHDLPEVVRKPGNKPVLGSFGVTGWHDEARSAGPGVTVGRSGASLGVVSYSPVDYWPLNTALYVTDFHGNDQLFAYYFLKQLDFRVYNSGSAQPSLNRNFIHPVPVDVPPLSEQHAIAHILGTLDDKIELNRRINETLEAMAQALFKDWFVDFGPTRAKIEGRDPYLAPEIWDLFPDKLDEDEKPEGWELRSLSDFANVVYGAPFASKQFNADKIGVPLIRIRDLATHEPGVSTEQVHKKGHLIEPGDIVVGMDGEFRLHVWKGPRSWLNQRLCHFEPKSGVPKAFLAEALRTPLAFFERGKVGTTVIHLGKSDIDTFEIRQPGQALLKAFARVAEALLDRTVGNALQSRTLGQTRDFLLPKLISGEVRVSDAGKIVQELT